MVALRTAEISLSLGMMTNATAYLQFVSKKVEVLVLDFTGRHRKKKIASRLSHFFDSQSFFNFVILKDFQRRLAFRSHNFCHNTKNVSYTSLKLYF